jgi:hypothetical protein
MPTRRAQPMNVRGMADQIREAGGQEFVSPNNVHDVLTSMHEVIESTQGALADIGRQVDEQPGIIRDYGDAAHEAAGSMSGAADALQQVTGPGITGQGGTGPGLHEVAQDIRSMGGKEFVDSDDVHNTLIDLHQIVDGTQEAMYQLGHKISELPGVVPEYSQAAFEAASSLQGIAENLQSRVGQGVTGQGPV